MAYKEESQIESVLNSFAQTQTDENEGEEQKESRSFQKYIESSRPVAPTSSPAPQPMACGGLKSQTTDGSERKKRGFGMGDVWSSSDGTSFVDREWATKDPRAPRFFVEFESIIWLGEGGGERESEAKGEGHSRIKRGRCRADIDEEAGRNEAVRREEKG